VPWSHAIDAADVLNRDNVVVAINARRYLETLVGRTIKTYRGRPNVILGVKGPDVLVGTSRSPSGQPVPIAWVQSAIDRLTTEGEVEVSVESLGHRSAFVGAVLATLPGATWSGGSPPTVRWPG
jgi:hypothetical protein